MTLDQLAGSNITTRPASWSATQQRAMLAVLLALCIWRLWLAPLTSSFWVDEMGTEFVVQHGAADPSFQVAPQVPASIYYVLPRIAQSLFGSSEVAYRIPSVVLMGIALLLIARIAQKLIHPDAAWFVVFACLLLREFDYQAADARPYALGTCVAAASLLFLIRWLDSARWLDGCLFGILAALLWRVHLLFWPFYLVFGIYTAVRLLRKQSSAGWTQVIVIYALLGVSLLPVMAQALALNREAGAHVVVDVPESSDFIQGLKLGYILPFSVISALLARWFLWPRLPRVTAPESLTLIFAWWLCDPFCLFAFSHLTGHAVFLTRYYYLALPGMALTAVVGAAVFLPSKYWKPAAAALGVGILLFQGHWNHLRPAHHNSNWRSAAAAINAELSGANEPVICPSPFVEARPPVWRPDYPLSTFLYSHLAAYPVAGKLYPFPFETSPEAERFAASLSRETLAASGKFVIYGGERAVHFWWTWFLARPELADWSARRLGSFGDVEAVVFQRPEIKSSPEGATRGATPRAAGLSSVKIGKAAKHPVLATRAAAVCNTYRLSDLGRGGPRGRLV